MEKNQALESHHPMADGIFLVFSRHLEGVGLLRMYRLALEGKGKAGVYKRIPILYSFFNK